MSEPIGIYLAGPIAGITFRQASGWRNYITEALRHERRLDGSHRFRLYNPMRHNQMFRGPNDEWADLPIDANHPATLEFFATFDPYQADKSDIIESKITVVHMPLTMDRMRGTLWECGLADAFNKRMILFPEQGYRHPFFSRFEKVCKDPDDVVDYLLSRFPC